VQSQRQTFLAKGKLALLALAAVALAVAAPAIGAAQHARQGEVLPHMDAALAYLRAGRAQLQDAEPVFSGHREKAIAHVDNATKDLQQGINNFLAAHPNAARNEINPEPPPTEGEQFPHMNGALKLLRQAEAQLSEATPQYNGRRVEGLAETRAAIAEIQVGLRDVHK
jgi:hypothetical protein